MGTVYLQSHKQPPTSAWGWNLSLSLASKDHSWEGPPSPEVEKPAEEERVGKRMGRVGGRWKEREGRESRREKAQRALEV